MYTQHIEKFAPVIRSLSAAELNGSPSLFTKLRLASDEKVDICYAPVEYINLDARLVLVGITPGKTQMLNSLKEARRQLDAGATSRQTLIAAKKVGGFSGPMRPNLISLLDRVGVHRWLGITGSDDLFGSSSHLVQSTSVLQNPVFLKDGSNYNGTPDMLRNPLLRGQLLEQFAERAKELPKAVFLPLGEKVADALMFLAERGCIDRNRILEGLPHPSPASMERINYFLGKKERHLLSSKTNASKLDLARELLTSRVAALA